MELQAIETAGAEISRASFTCEPAAIHAAADYLAKRIIEKRQTIPMLASLRIVADLGGTVTLTGADIDAGIYAAVTVPAEVASPGAFCVNAALLSDALAKLKKGGAYEARVTEELQTDWRGEETTRAAIKGGRGRFNVPTMPAANFPAPSEGIEPALSAVSMPAAQLLADLHALSPCISKDETRPYLHGIAIERRDMAGQDRLVMAATDGHGMAIASRALPDGLGELPQAILPGKAALALIAAGKAFGGDALAFEYGGSAFRFRLGDVSIFARPIDQTYPDFMRVFTDAMAPTGAQECLFPDLLPGAPVAMMEKLAKPFKGGLTWSPARQGFLGTVAGDDGLLFACMALTEADDCGRKGFSYTAMGATGEIEGPDGIAYPVAFSHDKIHLSKEQVRALIGESCFETIAVPIPTAHPLYRKFRGYPAHIARWCYDQGDSRLLIVKKDGRCFDPSKYARDYLMRDEIDALLAGTWQAEGEAAPEPIEISASAEPVEAIEPIEAPEPEALSGPEIGSTAIAGESHNKAADPLDEIAARVAALESRIATLSAASEVTPTARAKRTPAHERAIRRAWAERKARRESAAFHVEHVRAMMGEAEGLRAMIADKSNALTAEIGRRWIMEAKRRRSVLNARELGKRAHHYRANWKAEEALRAGLHTQAEVDAMIAVERERNTALRAELETATAGNAGQNELLAMAQAQAAAQMQRAMAAEEALSAMREELDRERVALAAVTDRNARLNQVLGDLGERFELMGQRVERAEAALRAAGIGVAA